MADDSKSFSIERCRELLGTGDSGLSDEEIEAIRVQTDAWAHVLLDIYLDQQRQERAREVTTNERGSIPVWSKMDLVGNKRLSGKRDSRRSNRTIFAATSACGDLEIWWPRFSPDGTH